MWFFKKKTLDTRVSDDYEARLTIIEQKIGKLARENVEIVMDIDNFRDKVLRKIQNKRKDIKDEETSPALDGLPRM